MCLPPDNFQIVAEFAAYLFARRRVRYCFQRLPPKIRVSLAPMSRRSASATGVPGAEIPRIVAPLPDWAKLSLKGRDRVFRSSRHERLGERPLTI